jgi:hypothetical protein
MNELHEGRTFLTERLMERALELKAKHQGDPETYRVELAKLLIANARNERERKEWEAMLKTNKLFQRWSQDDEREEVVKQVRTVLKARHPFIRFYVMRIGVRSSRRWEVQWCNGPPEAEIKDLVAPFGRKDLRFDYHRKSEQETR